MDLKSLTHHRNICNSLIVYCFGKTQHLDKNQKNTHDFLQATLRSLHNEIKKLKGGVIFVTHSPYAEPTLSGKKYNLFWIIG